VPEEVLRHFTGRRERKKEKEEGKIHKHLAFKGGGRGYHALNFEGKKGGKGKLEV